MGASVINNNEKMKEIIRACQVCNIAMVQEDGLPYLLPFNFGICEDYIWFHGSATGKKNDVLKNNPNVCVVFSNNYNFGHRNEEVACSYFFEYQSVMVWGKVEFIEDYDEKISGLNIIMKHFTGNDNFSYNAPAVNNVAVFRLKIQNISGRKYNR